ncbi:MAG: hypothetical protein RR478_00825, partial [Bacilli bacterium]
MAYTVTQKFKDIIYSGYSNNTAKLSIGGTIIPTSNIKSIKASNPIISKDKMCLGTFISNQLEITFRNMDNVPLTGDIYLEIGVKVDNAYEYVPIGYFIIDDLKEDYYTTCKITCLDRAVKMKTNVDISKQVPISAKNLLIWLCQKYNIVLGTYPLINNDVITNMYDSSYSGKKYVSMIAEIMGGFAKFGRDGKLYIIPLKRDSIATINAKKSKSFQKKELYKITRVVYEDAIRKFEYGTPTNNTLYISNDNFFITDTTVIQNIYNAVLNTEIWSLKTENYADISLDCWDYITYTIDNKNYITLNNNSYIYEQNIMSKVDVDIDIKSKQENTNKVVSNDKEQIRILKTEINQATGEIALLNKKVETVEVKIEK